MKIELLKWLCCPDCGSDLSIQNCLKQNGEIKQGNLRCPCGRNYKIENYIARFVDSDKYVNSFSFEWARHKTTQLDSVNKNNISEHAFCSRVDFHPSDFNGKLILDAGCGTGRYLEIVKKYGGTVIGVDLSNAIDVALENIGLVENTHFIQADLFHLPFKEKTFDFVFSFGVLHHTPDAQSAFHKIAKLVKEGRKISIFVYDAYEKAIVYSSNFWRKITTRLPKRLLYCLCYISIPLYYFYKIPVIGQIAKGIFVISMLQDWRWRLLDTFDWYSPKYQSKHTHWEVFNWFQSAGFKDIKIFATGITMMGTKG